MSNSSLSAARAVLVLVRGALSIEEPSTLQFDGGPLSSESAAEMLARHPKPVTILGSRSGEKEWTLRVVSEVDPQPPPVRLTEFRHLHQILKLSDSGGMIDWTDGVQVVRLDAAGMRELMTDYSIAMGFSMNMDRNADPMENERWVVSVGPPGIISENVDDVTDDEELKKILIAEAQKRSDPR